MRGSLTQRRFAVKIDKSHGKKAQLTGIWTRKLPPEMVAALSQGDGDGDIRDAMRRAAEQAIEATAAVTEEAQAEADSKKEAWRDLDR